MKHSFYKSTLLTILILSSVIFAFGQTEREKGIEFYGRGEYQKAVESLQKVVEADEKDGESWLYLGMSFAKSKKRKEAAKAFKKADKLFPEDAQEDKDRIKIVAKPRAGYTDAARENQVQGTIKLAIEFGADAEIKYIFGFETLPYGLTENTIKAASKIKFEPATKDGKPVARIQIVRYSFAIY